MSEDVFAIARQMRGHVPDLDDTYIEKWVPQDILEKIKQYKDKQFIDDDGFTWSPHCICATKIRKTGEIVVIIADKACGQGWHELKVIDANGNIRDVTGDEIL
jgi:hypothetical protein